MLPYDGQLLSENTSVFMREAYPVLFTPTHKT